MTHTPERRQSDSQLIQQAAEILIRLDHIDEHHRKTEKLRTAHVAEYHANLSPGEAEILVAEHVAMISDTALLVELVAGEEIIDSFTGHPSGQRRPGIAERVETLEYNANGGRGISIRTRDKLIIIIANGLVAGALAAIAVNI